MKISNYQKNKDGLEWNYTYAKSDISVIKVNL